MCRLAGVSRAGFYRRFLKREPRTEEVELRSEMQRIVLAHRHRYGYRRVTAALRAEGWAVNRKRVARLMRDDNLLALARRSFVATSGSGHNLPVAMNLAGRMEVTGVDQLWVADLTYIRLAEQFVYLAVVLDAFSRKVVGWSLGEQLDAALTVAALRQAIDLRQPKMGLVHHSDRGTQYASHAYAELLEEHGIVASMSRPANPYDNAQCESFMKTLKQEEIHTRSYRDLQHLEAHIGNFLDRYYNRRRLHSALGYRTPEEFERSLPAQPASAPVVTLSFPRHDGIDRPEERERTGERLEPSSSSSVRCVPAGYSSAGCSPAEPASASPARIKPQTTTPARQEKYSERQTGNFHRVSR
jgi:transposase InsO family protein